MLDGIGDEDIVSHDAGCLQGIVEQLTRGADERFARSVFAVSGLLADHHDGRMPGAGARDALCRVVPERAAAAFVQREWLLMRVILHGNGAAPVQ